MMSFTRFGLCEPIVRALAAENYETPTPIQAAAIPPALEGKDVLGLAQTGTGKTAAFALPVLQKLMNSPRPKGKPPIRALILSPTRELALQIGQSIETYGKNSGLRHTVVVGGVGFTPQIRALAKGVDLLIATPGRLEDLRRQGYINLGQVEVFVLDEADRMLDIGFLPEIQRMIQHLPKERQTLFFSATMGPKVVQLANDILKDPVHVEIKPVAETTNLISQSVCFVARSQKTRFLAQMLADAANHRAIVFTRTKRGADKLVDELRAAGTMADSIHGNKSQGARQRVLAEFKSNRVSVMVATDLAARGIDVDGVTHVFNYDLPVEPENYVHRIGRTGRAGDTGIAVTLCDRSERRQLSAIERLIKTRIPADARTPAGNDIQAPDSGDQNRRGSDRHGSDRRGADRRRSQSRPARSGNAGFRRTPEATQGEVASATDRRPRRPSAAVPERRARRPRTTETAAVESISKAHQPAPVAHSSGAAKQPRRLTKPIGRSTGSAGERPVAAPAAVPAPVPAPAPATVVRGRKHFSEVPPRKKSSYRPPNNQHE